MTPPARHVSNSIKDAEPATWPPGVIASQSMSGERILACTVASTLGGWSKRGAQPARGQIPEADQAVPAAAGGQACRRPRWPRRIATRGPAIA